MFVRRHTELYSKEHSMVPFPQKLRGFCSREERRSLVIEHDGQLTDGL